MQDFSKFNKKEKLSFSDSNFELGKKIKLVAPLSFYGADSEFTVVTEAVPNFTLEILGIGETYLQDDNGKVLLIKGNKKYISSLFEDIEPTSEPEVVVEQIVEEPKELIFEDIKISLKKELVKELKEELVREEAEEDFNNTSQNNKIKSEPFKIEDIPDIDMNDIELS